MIVSDKKFIEKHQENDKCLPPENEEWFSKFSKIEKIFAAVGGAILTYATVKSNNSKTWLNYTAAVLGGALVIRGALGSSKNKVNEEEANSGTSADKL